MVGTNQDIRFMLFVMGKSPRSERARLNLLKLCDEKHVKVIDIVEDASAAIRYGVLATPTVIRTEDSLTLVGTLDDLDRVAGILDLESSN